MSDLIPYYEECRGYGYTTFREIKPTGRWRLVRNIRTGEWCMMIQYKGWLFKHWIAEDDIKFMPPRESVEFSCYK